jgi:hypothetical protein
MSSPRAHRPTHQPSLVDLVKRGPLEHRSIDICNSFKFLCNFTLLLDSLPGLVVEVDVTRSYQLPVESNPFGTSRLRQNCVR